MKVRIACLAALAAAVALISPAASNAATTVTPVKPLPAGFLWGVATSGFQSEGSSPDSNWTRYVAASKGKDDPIGTSADFRHRYASDIALAKNLGVKVYRLSIEWARIEPQPGVWDQTELAYYDSVINTILANGMRPMITLDHWVYPGWEAARGGWAGKTMPSDWLTFAKRVVNRYVYANPLWVTFNEATFYAVQELQNKGLSPLSLGTMLTAMVNDHKAIYTYIHARQPAAMVTSNVAYIPSLASELDALFLNRIASSLDFIGIDYYYSINPTDLSAYNAFIGTPWKATVAADGIYYTLRHYATAFPKKPLYIVENGMSTDNGAPRPDGYDRANLLRDDIYWLQRARDAGMNVIGYNYWSLTDNYEWGSYSPRFGLYTVNVLTDPTLTRHPTDAVPAYTAIIAANGDPSTYRPTRPPVFCSLVDAPSSCLNPVRP
ncbi:MAG: family 1 glycosylhydrolase [Marmoricola sp.]